MDRDELAALLAQTHSLPHSSTANLRPVQSPPRSPISPQRSSTSPLSPRQIFQSRVRTLSDDENPSRVPPFPRRPRCELQHLSSLRVHARQSGSRNLPPPSRSSHRYLSKDGRFGFSTAEPEFVAEERAAWSTERDERSAQGRSETRHNETQLRDNAFELQIDQDESLPKQRLLGLKPFGPASAPVDLNERPKTSRGSQPAISVLPGAYPQDEPGANDPVTRKSKFLEGSMNERSVAIASTWNEHGLRLSESSDRSRADTDSDATPRASRISRDSSSSVDASEFRPPPTTPSTITGKLSKLVKRASEDSAKPIEDGKKSKLVKRASEDSAKPIEDGKKSKKKGLRKSISTWSFHNIGDKIKFFGASSNDLPGDHESSIKKNQPSELAVLDERKRKAEEVYAQQFGTKKQKSNDGIPVQDRRAPRGPGQPRTLKKRPVSPRTVIPATVRHRRREASEPPDLAWTKRDVAYVRSETAYDHRKRVSRSELEKENQHLRAMLREHPAQQTGTMHRSASKSRVYLPIDTCSQASSSRGRSASRSTSPVRTNMQSARAVRTKKQKQHQDKDIPPVPALPSRVILASLDNNGGNTGPCAVDTGTMKLVGFGRSRPVPTILEEDVENGQDKANEPATWKSSNTMSPQPPHPAGLRKDDWQWPDDIF